MKQTLLTLTLALSSFVAIGQTKIDSALANDPKWQGIQSKTGSKLADSSTIVWGANDKNSQQTIYSIGTMGSSRYSDTLQCYFLKVPAVVESPLQAIVAKWYLGYSVRKWNEFQSHYLYFDKSPVLEQVLISIPKESK